MRKGYCRRCDARTREHMGRCYDCGYPLEETEPETERTRVTEYDASDVTFWLDGLPIRIEED